MDALSIIPIIVLNTKGILGDFVSTWKVEISPCHFAHTVDICMVNSVDISMVNSVIDLIG
jgi:hypothetical protein